MKKPTQDEIENYLIDLFRDELRGKFAWLHKIFVRKRYWYEVRFIYQDKDKRRKFDFVQSVGVVNQSDILNRKLVKRLVLTNRLNDVNPMLCNGRFVVEVICYLGYFKNIN